MPPTDPILRAWWPTTQSIDLVRAPPDETARAVEAQFRRLAENDPVETRTALFPDLDAVFSLPNAFFPGPTFVAVLPTRSAWTALWYNDYLCSGFESLCWCLTQDYGLTTVHWCANDDTTVFQPGAMFHHRRREGAGMVERRVQVARNDSKWTFDVEGAPLPEEDLSLYEATRKSERLNEKRLMELLARLGASPWSEDFYDLSRNVVTIERAAPPIETRSSADVRKLPRY